MKNYESSKAKCPLYQREEPQVIHCFGFNDNMRLWLTFVTRTHCKRYKEQYCYCDYEQCRVFKMVLPSE